MKLDSRLVWHFLPVIQFYYLKRVSLSVVSGMCVMLVSVWNNSAIESLGARSSANLLDL